MSESFRPIPLRINYNTANLIDTDGESLYANATPAFRLGEKGIIEATFVQDDNSTAQPFNSTDTFEFYADKDFIHNLDTGALTQGYSGAVTSIKADGLSSTPASSGSLNLQNSSGQSEPIAYTSWTLLVDVYTFVVDDTLTYVYLNNDTCYTGDPLMIYSPDSQVDIVGDWSNISRTGGKISIRYNAFTNAFLSKIGTAEQISLYIQINRYLAGQTRPSTAMQYQVFAGNVVRYVEGQTAETVMGQYSQAEVDALIAGREVKQTYFLSNVNYRTEQQNLVATVPSGKIFIPKRVLNLTTAIAYVGESSSSTFSLTSQTSTGGWSTTTETTTTETSLSTTTETSLSTTTETSESTTTESSSSTQQTKTTTTETTTSESSSTQGTHTTTTESTTSESSSTQGTHTTTSANSTTSVSVSTTSDTTTTESSSSTQQTHTTTTETSESSSTQKTHTTTSANSTTSESSSTQGTHTTTTETTTSESSSTQHTHTTISESSSTQNTHTTTSANSTTSESSSTQGTHTTTTESTTSESSSTQHTHTTTSESSSSTQQTKTTTSETSLSTTTSTSESSSSTQQTNTTTSETSETSANSTTTETTLTTTTSETSANSSISSDNPASQHWTANGNIIGKFNDDLESYWAMENIQDSVGTNTLINNNAIAFVAGKHNNSAGLVEPSSKYFSIASPTVGLRPADTFFASLWFNIDTLPPNYVAMNIFDFNFNIRVYYYNTDHSYEFTMSMKEGGGGDKHVVYVNTFDTETWYHLMVCGDGTNLKMYINGTQQGGDTAYDGTIRTDDSTYYIGSSRTPNQYWDGEIDEFGFWSSPTLSAGKANTLATAFTNGITGAFYIPHLISSSSTTI